MNRRDFVLGNATNLAVGVVGTLGVSQLLGCVKSPSGGADPNASASASGAPAAAACPPVDPDLGSAHLSFAQNGEDLVLRQAVCDTAATPKPEYMDIGAWDPINGNNTYYFYRLGCRGVLVEPNPVLGDKLAKVRSGDKLVRAGIRGQGYPAEADYFMIADSQLNTFDKDVAKNYKVEKVVKMPLLDINQVMADNFKTPPALLSLDAEGMDLTILKSLDWVKWRPKVIIAEAWTGKNGYDFDADIMAYMAAQNFTFHGGSMVNAVWVDSVLLKKKT